MPPSACTVTARPAVTIVAVGAEQERLHRAVVGGDAVDRQVAARRALVGHRVLGALDAFEHRQLAVVVVVDADAEIDLVRIGVGDEGLGDAEDGVARGEFDGGQERCGSGAFIGRQYAGGESAHFTRLRTGPIFGHRSLGESEPRAPR